MTKFFANGSMISTLINSRDDVAACRSAMDAALKVANGRTFVVPKMWGGYLPHVLKTTSGVEVVADRDDFKKQREEAIASARAAAEERAARRDQRVCRMLPAAAEGQRTVTTDPATLEAKRAAKARSLENHQRRAEENRRRANGGTGGNNKKKAA